MRGLAPWALTGLACAAAGLAADALGLPAPWLLAGLVGGLAVAVARGSALQVPRAPTVVSQATVGVTLGAAVAPGSLSGLAGAWWAVLAVVALTLGLSVAVALLLARVTGLDRVTAGLGLLPGAAPALVSVGDDVGADARLVATMQYARVLLVVASVPALALLLGSGSSARPGRAVGPEPLAGLEPVLVAVLVGLVGAGLAALARSPAASLVGPLLLSAAAGATGLLPIAVPSIASDVAFVTVGASVGLRFDRGSLRHAGRLAPYMAGGVLALTVGSAALGLVLLAALDTDPLTAYLATTPGGISSVLAATFDSGADLTIVVAVQTLRLMLLALIAPFAARLLRVPVPA